MNHHAAPSQSDHQLSLWSERAMKAASHQSDVSSSELESWQKSADFTSAYQTAMRAKSALLSETSAADSDEAFRRFIRRHRVSRVLLLRAVLAAAAACIAAWLFLSLPTPSQPSAEAGRADSLLYHARSASDSALVIATAHDTLRLTSPSSAASGDAVSISVSGNRLHLQPVDYRHCEITRSTLTVPQGMAAQLELSDGSQVWLNACSSLIYPSSFKEGEARRVHLCGEAYFEVARDPSRPFIVDCDGLQTRVLGTAFNIRSYEGRQPSVTLVSGSVEVSSEDCHVTLQPLQTVVIGDSGAMSIDSDVDVESVTCWRENRFYFDGSTLRDIMIELGRWYNMDVMIGSNSHLSDRLHFRGERQWTIQQVVEQMNLISNAEILIDGNTLVVY